MRPLVENLKGENGKDSKKYVRIPIIEMNEDGTIDGKRLKELLGVDENWPTAWDMVMGERSNEHS